jgi:magnesium transporter
VTVVGCALYRNGVRSEESGHNILRLAADARRDPNAFVWMGLLEPTVNDLRGVATAFGLHPLAVEDAIHAHQRPKVDVYDDSLFVVLRTLGYRAATHHVDTGEISMFIGPHFAVTVRHGDETELGQLRNRLESQTEILQHGPTAVLWAVSDKIVDDYLTVATALESDVVDLEARVLAPERTDEIERIYTLKREVITLRRATTPLIRAIIELQDSQTIPIPGHVRPFFRDVYDHCLRVQEMAEAMDQILTGMLQAHLAQIGVQQNADMRRITAWAAIFAVITAIAGIYGMNFTFMPELTWRFGYPAVLIFMAGTALVLYRAFKRSGWL